ncbi:MAG: 50S ribosomal protein L6 [Candidatus Diapherotrites archaeon]|nr:50S ribosomal protein L6 [Candidatus Diapherotrites archaeon]
MSDWIEVESVTLPEGFTATLNESRLEIAKAGKKMERNLAFRNTALKVEGNSIKISIPKENKKNRATAGSIRAHIHNMINGVENDFTYKLKVFYEHFPMKVNVKGDKVEIDNFIGRKKKIYAKILPEVKVNVQGQEITVSSPYKDRAGQTAANIETATRQTKLCDRKFLDSVFISYKP